MLCLQEIDRAQHRSGGEHQTAAVAAGMGVTEWRFAAAIVGEPGGRWRAATDGDDGNAGEPAYGVGLVSRLPVDAWHTVYLAAAPVRSPVAVPGGRGRFVLLPDEPRAAVAASLAGLDLLVGSTHLSFVPVWNLVQLRRLTRRLAALAPRSAVLLGDLNTPGPFPRLAAGRRWRSLGRTKTYPAGRAWLQVDHVLATGAVPPVAAVEARRLPLSDHLALIVELAVDR